MADDFAELDAKQRRKAIAQEKTLNILVVLAIVLAVLTFPTMGFMGLIILAPFYDFILPRVLCRPPSDWLWPYAFVVNFLWPFSIPLGYGVGIKSGWFSELYRPLIFLLVMFLWALLLSLGLCFSY